MAELREPMASGQGRNECTSIGRRIVSRLQQGVQGTIFGELEERKKRVQPRPIAWNFVVSLCCVSMLASAPISARAPVAASAAPSTCGSAEVGDRVSDAISELFDTCGQTAACWREMTEVMARALRDHPENFYVHETLKLAHVGYRPDGEALAARDALRERYRRWALAHPEDPFYLVSSAFMALDQGTQLAWDENPESAAAQLDRALALDPDFPWAHLAKAVAAYRYGHGDGATAVRHMRRFRELCPGESWMLSWTSDAVESLDFWRAELPKLRATIEARPLAEAYRRFEELWSLEKKYTAPEGQPAMIEGIARDLERIEALDIGDTAWTQMMMNGARTLGDDRGMRRWARRLLEITPCHSTALVRLVRYRQEQHPVDTEASDEQRKARHDALVAAYRSELEACPRSEPLHYFLYQELDGAPWPSTEAMRDAGLAYVAAWEAERSSTPPHLRVAEDLLDRGVTGSVSALLDAAPTALEARYESRTTFDPDNEERQHSLRLGLEQERWRTRAARVLLLALEGRSDAARASLPELEQSLISLRPVPGEGVEHQEKMYREAATRLYRLHYQLASVDGRTLDAARWLRRVASVDARAGDALERARELWFEGGGTEADWRALSDEESPRTVIGWTKKNQPLHALDLRDVHDRVWSSEELRGKTVFASVWAPWCAPCRPELPLIQKLHELLAKDPKSTVITFYRDSASPASQRPFLEENGYTFPVLGGKGWLDREIGLVGMPYNLIIGPDGHLRRTHQGFDAETSGEQWLESVLQEMAAVAAEVPSGQ